jgi:phenylalanyl-tRNA synthetase alpha subunit
MSDLDSIRSSFNKELEAADSAAAIEEIRIKYLGKKGVLTGELKRLGSLHLKRLMLHVPESSYHMEAHIPCTRPWKI